MKKPEKKEGVGLGLESILKKNTAALFLNRSLAKVVAEGVADDWAKKEDKK